MVVSTDDGIDPVRYGEVRYSCGIPGREFMMLLEIFHDILEGFLLLNIHAVADFLLVIPVVDHFEGLRRERRLRDSPRSVW